MGNSFRLSHVVKFIETGHEVSVRDHVLAWSEQTKRVVLQRPSWVSTHSVVDLNKKGFLGVDVLNQEQHLVQIFGLHLCAMIHVAQLTCLSCHWTKDGMLDILSGQLIDTVNVIISRHSYPFQVCRTIHDA